MADDPTIRWAQATSFGISVDSTADAWHSGHVTESLELTDADAFLVATETGGVWMVADNGTQLQLSDSWNDPDSSCLAFGPDGPRHVFAGCTLQYSASKAPTVMETDAASASPLLNWKPVIGALPDGIGRITRLVVIPHLRRIVVACKKAFKDETPGIYWAVIPPSFGPGARPPYVWKRATGDDEPTEGYYDLALAATGDGTRRDQLEDIKTITIVAGGKSGGLFVGRFEGPDLVMRRAKQLADGGVDVTLLEDAGACSVASCEAHPNVVYASCSMPDGRMMQVVRSDDGGQTWRMCGSQLMGGLWGSLLAAAGDQGNGWNNRVAVAPDDPNLVIVAWSAGPFVSFDAGHMWSQIGGDPHLHADWHALLFTKRTVDGERVLHVGGDGGFASVNLDRYFRGLPDAFRSNYNRNLPTLQIYSTLIRQFYGTLDGSREHPGLVSIGVQDNGNLYCHLNDPDNAWFHIDGGDGGWNAFLSDGALAHNIKGEAVTVASFANPAPFDMAAPLTQPPDPKGMVGPAAEAVTKPTYRNAAHQLLAAVAAVKNDVFGLFVDDDDAPRYHWERIGSVPAGLIVTAVASYHGGTVFAGTQGDGRMFAVDTKQGTALELPVVLPKPTPSSQMKGGTFTRIVLFQESEVFAVLNGASEQPASPLVRPAFGPAPAPLVASYVVRLDTLRFVNTPGAGLPNEYMYGCAAATAPGSRVPRALFVSTDDAVYISRDDGTTWQRASQGLPRRPHCGDLRFVTSPRAGANLYLGTFGRSLWVAKLAVNG